MPSATPRPGRTRRRPRRWSSPNGTMLDPEDNKPWTAKQTAGWLGFSLDVTYKLIHQGFIPATMFGKRWRIDPQELQRWVREGALGRRVQAQSERGRRPWCSRGLGVSTSSRARV